MHAQATTRPGEEPEVLSEGLRGILSFLLFLHFFALAVAVSSNYNPSPLELKLRDVPGVRPYTQLLGMDRSYVALYNLTRGEELDTDHAIVASLEPAGGDKREVVLPGPEIRLPQRRDRYARLAASVASLVGNPAVESILPQAIAAHLVHRHRARGGTIACRRHYLQTTEALASSDPTRRDPFNERYFQRVYQANIVTAGGQVQVLKIESAADVAPAAAPGEGQ